MKKAIAALGILISIGALYLALKDIHFDQVWAAFGHLNPLVFLLVLPFWLVAIGAKVFRWRLLYHPDEARAPYSRLTSALLIGYLFNTVLPLRTGEVVRATVLRATAGLPVARTLSTILVEKVLDTMALIVMLVLVLPFLGASQALPADVSNAAGVATVVFGGLFVAVLWAALWPDQARGLRNRLLPLVPARLRPPVTGLSDQVLDGLLPLRRRETAPGLVGWTAISWITNVISSYFLLGSFGLWLPFTAPTLLVDATNLVMTVPSAPGYVGVYHLTAQKILQIFGVDADTALAAATFLHAFGFLPLAVAGFISMIREGLSWGSVQTAAPDSPESTQNAELRTQNSARP
jgi:uncharacterized membrane protein YbhN (UPF0104 family)